jgi:SAM-dependent methyltransferase
MSEKESFMRNECRICDSQNTETVLSFGSSPVADQYVAKSELGVAQSVYPLDVALCGTCGLVYLKEVVSPDILYGKYLYETKSSPKLDEHFEKYAASVIQALSLKQGALVVDVGSNDGTLLRAFQKKGMRIFGIDPATDVAKRATEQGIETLPRYFSQSLAKELRSERGGADLIVANNVMANIDNLHDFGQGVGTLLSDNGVFIFETGYLMGTLEKMVFDNVYHEHYSYFSVKPLKSLFDRLGLELFDVEVVHSKGGSLRGKVQRKEGGRPVSPSVENQIAYEESKGAYTPATYIAYTAKLNLLKDQTKILLADLKAKGERVVGYGASASVTTVLYAFQIADKLDFLVDDNPIKQNRYSPGYHLPIYPSSYLDEKDVRHVVILPWRFADPIISKHERFKANGGKFIVPIPELSVVG